MSKPKTIYYKCGCTKELQCSKSQAQDEQLHAGEMLCPECQTAMKERQAQATAQAKEANQDLPALTGTEKQIAWAETIRAKQAVTLRSVLVKSQRASGSQVERIRLAAEALLQRTDAKAWIDTRDCTYGTAWLMQQ